MKYKRHPIYSIYSLSDTGIVYNNETKRKIKTFYRNGYVHCIIQTKKGIINSWRTRPVHVLVAEAWFGIQNGTMRMVVDHINEVGDDNRIDNLEWVTCRESTRRALRNRNRQRTLHSYDATTGKYLDTYDFSVDVERDGFSPDMARAVANGRYRQTKGVVFKDEKFDYITPLKPLCRRTTPQDIFDAILELIAEGEHITIQKIAGVMKKTRQTVMNHISYDLRDIIKDHNELIKTNKS